MISDPNVRRKALELMQNLNTEDLVSMLSIGKPTSLPVSDYEDFKAKLRDDKKPRGVDNTILENHTREYLPKHEVTHSRSQYLSGYGPKAEGVAGNKRAYLSEKTESPVGLGRHDKFEVKQPELPRASQKPREYLRDDVDYGTDGSEDYVPGGGNQI